QNANLKKLEVFVKDHKEVIKKIKELKRVFGGGVGILTMQRRVIFYQIKLYFLKLRAKLL
ncbi:MAG: hypothetical protein E7K04_05655, partial [Helicobacter sp.]|nr:hypothetical protein [Helicobacter sp.]